ncbi:MAG: hypothetical protein HY270_08295 [Deltaproteobacteria bacterium]|nr:hypothetical protein [Deltaproteobacteria bacterium]
MRLATTNGTRSRMPASAALCVLAASVALAQGPQAGGDLGRCTEVATILARDGASSAEARHSLRLEAERAIPAAHGDAYVATCYQALARSAAADGDYDAERLYLRSAELAPNDPAVLEAVGRYYRVYRGSHGLFADSERFYVRAEQAARSRSIPTRIGSDIVLDSIRRGRIDLVRDEGLGLLVPKQAGEQLGVYFASAFDYGRFTLPQGELARITTQPLMTPPPAPIGGPSPPPAPTPDANANARTAIQDRNHLDLLERLRLRFGNLPYLDVTWAHNREQKVAPLMQTPPPTPARGMPPPPPPGLALDDSTSSTVAVALEDDAGFAPLGDLLWRVEYTHERRKPDQAASNETDRTTASATWTRNLGRFKTDFSAVAGSSFDGEYIAGGGLHVVHFLDAAPPLEPRTPSLGGSWRSQLGANNSAVNGPLLSPPPRPPSNDYVLAYRREELHTPDGSKVISHVAQLGAHFLDALPARTDVAVASLLDVQHPQTGGPDTGNVELRFDLVNRLIDRLLEPDAPRTGGRLATNRAALSLGYLEDLAVRGTDRFESRGLNAGVRLETFSVPLNFSTIVIELSYQLRDYYHIGEVRHVPWLSVRAGLGGP